MLKAVVRYRIFGCARENPLFPEQLVYFWGARRYCVVWTRCVCRKDTLQPVQLGTLIKAGRGSHLTGARLRLSNALEEEVEVTPHHDVWRVSYLRNRP